MTIDDGRGRAPGPGGGTPATARFSPSEAAFTGLRLLTREPRTWLIWGALVLAFSLVVGGLTVVLAGPALMELMTASRATPQDPTVALALMGRLGPMYGVVMLCSLLFYAVAFAAVNRAVLRPSPAGFAHLAVGGDELRQLIVLVLLSLVFLGVYIASVIVGAIVGVVLGVILAVAHVGGTALMVLAFLLVGLLVFGTIVFVMTRLSLASPIALDTGRIDLGASWRLTRGRFWPLLGAYVLAWLVTLVLFIAMAVVFVIAALATGGGLTAASALLRPDMSTLQTYFVPLQILWMVVNAAMAPVFFALGLGAPAGAYALLRGTASPVVAGPSAAISDLPRFGR